MSKKTLWDSCEEQTFKRQDTDLQLQNITLRCWIWHTMPFARQTHFRSTGSGFFGRAFPKSGRNDTKFAVNKKLINPLKNARAFRHFDTLKKEVSRKCSRFDSSTSHYFYDYVRGVFPSADFR